MINCIERFLKSMKIPIPWFISSNAVWFHKQDMETTAKVLKMFEANYPESIKSIYVINGKTFEYIELINIFHFS